MTGSRLQTRRLVLKIQERQEIVERERNKKRGVTNSNEKRL
jgi:hypothetical protein